MTDQFEYDVFLSFSSADEAIVRPLWQELCSSGLRVFWSDATLRKEVGRSWFEVIENSLEQSRHMLLVCSENAIGSKWVQREYRAFFDQCHTPGSRRLIPVLTRDFDAGRLPFFLRELQAGRLDDPQFIREVIPLLGGVDIGTLQNEVRSLQENVSALLDENASLRKSLQVDTAQVKELALKSLQAAQKLDTFTNDIERKVSAMEGYYQTFTEAFPAMAGCIRSQIAKCREAGVPDPVFEMKHIAVAMSFSWSNFITTQIKTLLSDEDTRSATFNIQAAFVDPGALKGLTNPAGNDWARKSRDMIRDIAPFKKTMAGQFGDHFSFEYKTYSNLPHWHGWLITTAVNEEKFHHLFMGRTKWEFSHNRPGKYPSMTVGHNEYRYYTESSQEGRQRIELFEQWHRYYFNFDTPLGRQLRRQRK